MTQFLTDIQSLFTVCVNVINTLLRNELFMLVTALYLIRSYLVPLWNKMMNKK